MPDMMWQTAKHEGVGNIVLEHVPIPEVGPEDVLTRTKVSLISRGSELWRRYVYEEALPPSMMGYSTTGIVERVGADVRDFSPGDWVVVGAPHAEYSLASGMPGNPPEVRALHADVSPDEGTFHPLCTSSASWTKCAQITPEDRVVVLGQGIVGNLVMQFARRYRPAQLIAVDALDLRLRIAREGRCAGGGPCRGGRPGGRRPAADGRRGRDHRDGLRGGTAPGCSRSYRRRTCWRAAVCSNSSASITAHR